MDTPTLAQIAAQVQALVDVEQIKRLKYRYFRCFDTADLCSIAELFHPDVTLEVNGGAVETPAGPPPARCHRDAVGEGGHDRHAPGFALARCQGRSDCHRH